MPCRKGQTRSDHHGRAFNGKLIADPEANGQKGTAKVIPLHQLACRGRTDREEEFRLELDTKAFDSGLRRVWCHDTFQLSHALVFPPMSVAAVNAI